MQVSAKLPERSSLGPDNTDSDYCWARARLPLEMDGTPSLSLKAVILKGRWQEREWMTSAVLEALFTALITGAVVQQQQIVCFSDQFEIYVLFSGVAL